MNAPSPQAVAWLPPLFELRLSPVQVPVLLSSRGMIEPVGGPVFTVKITGPAGSFPGSLEC
jgi:hypothetical protein